MGVYSLICRDAGLIVVMPRWRFATLSPPPPDLTIRGQALALPLLGEGIKPKNIRWPDKVRRLSKSNPFPLIGGRLGWGCAL